MRVATVDGLVTLFYDGTRELFNRELNNERLIAHGRRLVNQGLGSRADDLEAMDVSEECKRYFRERLSWQQIIVVEGVTEIPSSTFYKCINIKRVIFANTVIRIRGWAFMGCKNLVYIKWSLRLEYIGQAAFQLCNLSSVFIPPRCREIGDEAFEDNTNLSLLNVPDNVELGRRVINRTALLEASDYSQTTIFPYNLVVDEDNVNQWLKNMNNDENFALHRACASFNPLIEVIHAIILQKGLKAFRVENSAGITPSRYLQENPYTELSEKEIIHDYLMKMMGDIC